MKCPFLQEERTKFCSIAPYRKMIVQSSADTAHERCSGPLHRHCSLAVNVSHPPHSHLPSSSDRCPFLEESLMEYCGAASVPKFVPYSESEQSRCRRPAYRYCDLFLSMASPEGEPEGGKSLIRDGENLVTVDGIPVPTRLSYSPNHMWLDLSDDGECQIGMDAFLASLVGPVDELTFLPMKAVGRPAVVLTVRGQDLPLTFPNALLVRSANLYLRAHPERLAADPYTFGWLFEGTEPKQAETALEAGLIPGSQAGAWMEQEVERLTTFVHERLSGQMLEGKRLAADGGVFSGDLLDHLSRDGILCLFNEFFSPYQDGRRWR